MPKLQVFKVSLSILLTVLLSMGNAWAVDSHALYLEAYKYFTKSHYKKAIPLLQQSLKEDPNFTEAHFLLSRVYFKMGNPRVAIQSFKRGQRLKRRIKDQFEFLGSEGALKIETGTRSIPFQSIQRIQRAKKAYHNGRRAIKEGRFYEAVEFFERAAALDTEQLDYINAHGFALLDTRDLFSAQEVLERSLSVDPFQRDIYEKLIELNGELNYPDDALKWAQQAKQFFPADPYFRDRELYFDYRARINRKNHGQKR